MQISAREFSDSSPIATVFIQMTADEVALMPKSYRAARMISVEMYADRVNEGRNETGIKRINAMIKKVRAAGGEVTTNTEIVNGASLESILAYLAS